MAPGRQGDLPHHLGGLPASDRSAHHPGARAHPGRRLDVETWTASTPSCAGVAGPVASRCRPAPSAPFTRCCPGRYGRRWPGAGFRITRPGWPPRRRCSAATWPRHRSSRWPACWRPRWAQSRAGAVPAAGGGAGRPPRACARCWRHVDLDRGEVLLERGVVYVSQQPLIDKATKTRSKRASPWTPARWSCSAHTATGRQVPGSWASPSRPAPTCSAGSRTGHGRSPAWVSHQFAALARSLGCDAACTTFGT